MVSQQVLCAFVLVLVCAYVSAAPNPEPLPRQGQQDLADRFVEFLREDKEFAAALHDFGGHLRVRRQNEMGIDDSQEGYEPPQEKPGFFDRAAKFVTELLQRFLKWINSNDDN